MWFKMHPWVFPAIIGVIGILYLIINVGAIIETKKIQKEGSDHHISGIPFLGGIHLLIAGLISPIKWLALLCVLDFTFWGFLYAIFIESRTKKSDSTEKLTKDHELPEKPAKPTKILRTVKASGVGISDVLVFLMLLIFSIAGFVGRNTILGYLAGTPALLLFPYLTNKRPYFKADDMGVLYRKASGFQYGQTTYLKWEQVDAIIMGNQIFTIDEKSGDISESELNAKTLACLDAFAGCTQEKCEDMAEWIENGFFIVIKQLENGEPQLIEIGSFFKQKDVSQKFEMIKDLWQHYLNQYLENRFQDNLH